MTYGVSFSVLGPLGVTVGSRKARAPASGKQRILLASLLLKANDIVPVDELIDRLWGECLPDNPRRALHTCLARMRRTLEEYETRLSATLRTLPGGYSIEASAECLDHLRFQKLTRKARNCAQRGDLDDESVILADALSMWRVPVLPDVPSPSLHREVVPRLTEEWLRAVERSHDVDLALGRHTDLVGDLRALTRRYPNHERFWCQLMLTLYRCGRQVEALEAFRDVRDHLRHELGVNPGEEICRLHLAILRNAADLTSVPAFPPAPRPTLAGTAGA